MLNSFCCPHCLLPGRYTVTVVNCRQELSSKLSSLLSAAPAPHGLWTRTIGLPFLEFAPVYLDPCNPTLTSTCLERSTGSAGRSSGLSTAPVRSLTDSLKETEVEITSLLSRQEVDRALRLFTNELAWTRGDTIEVAKRIAAHGYAILGGDIWHLKGPDRWAPRGAGATWETERLPSETDDQYVARCLEQTLSFLSSQPEVSDDDRRYVLTVDTPDFMQKFSSR